MRRPLVAGNWKMNGLRADSLQRTGELYKRLSEIIEPCFDLLICPPFTIMETVATAISNSGIYLGGQDCHSALSGSYTGDISAEMLADIGCSHVILGHSERRSDHDETNDVVRSKASAAIGSNLITIICIGETLEEKNNNKTENVLKNQLEEIVPESSNKFNTIIAYEPIWAIGTGLTPSLEEIENAHRYIKNLSKKLFNFKIIYGGSVNSKNSKLISKIDIVNGALIGGASLKINEFKQIIS